MQLRELLEGAVKHGASDIHVVPERSPFLRINGKMKSIGTDAWSGEQTRRVIQEALQPSQIEAFEAEGELDTSLTLEGLGRFRVNVLRQKDGIGAVLRVISTEIPKPEELGLDDTMIGLTDVPRGLILVTGPTGSGKSTTLASLVNLINETRREHILTIEDPIEYVYPRGRCVITQREVGQDTASFQGALKRAMRQDPDIILIGELRDLETISAALTLAETGHLVFGTLHTTDAAQTVDRIIDVFPPYQQQQIRAQLSTTLRAVICQQLLPTTDGRGRVAAREVMIVNPAIANLIRDGKTHQIYNAIEVGGKLGMRSLDRDLGQLVQRGTITREAAIAKANNPDAIRSRTGGGRL
jgi:twitching motility protein PilT